MKIIIGSIGVAIVMGASPAYAHDYSPEPQEQVGHVIKYNRGNAIVFSETSNSTVAIEAMPITEYNFGKVTFVLSFANRTQSDAIIDPNAVTVSLAAGKPVKVITAQDLSKKARGDAALASFSSSMGSLSRATLGAQPTTVTGTTTYSGGTIHSTTTINNPSQRLREVQQNQAQTKNEQEAIQDGLASALDDIRETALLKTTVAAGQTDKGTLLLQVPKLKEGDDRTMTISVSFAGDEHTFRYTMNKFRP